MKKKRFTDEPIAYALRQAESGASVPDVRRQMSCSEASNYICKKRFAHLGLTELKELRQLRDESARLKRLVADLTLDKHILGEVVQKSSEAVAMARARTMDLRSLSTGRATFVPVGRVLPHRLVQVYSCARSIVLRRQGWLVNQKRIRRLYRIEGLQLRMRVRRRKHMCLHRGPVPKAQRTHERWSLDFGHDQLFDERTFRILTVIDQL